MKQQEKKRNTDTLLALMLLAVFMVCVLVVLFTGVDAYRRLHQRDAVSYDRRTAVQYVAARVRQADAAGAVSIGEFRDGRERAEGDTLFLRETVDGKTYCTRIYCYDGYVRELFAELSGDFSPEDGEKLLAADGLRFSRLDGGVKVEILHAGGDSRELILRLRSGEVVS